MTEDLLGVAFEKASNAFLFEMLSQCVEGRVQLDEYVAAGVKRVREYVERARKVGKGLVSKETVAFNSGELDAYLEVSEALARPEPEAFEAETSLLVKALNDIEGRAEFDSERKQKTLALLTRLGLYFSRKFAERTQAVQRREDD